ncbi:hypothetical protein P3S68_002693 [Capsicum galapagoense]
MTTITTTTSLLSLKKLVFFYLIFLSCLNYVTSIRELSDTSTTIEPSSSNSRLDGTYNYVMMKPQRNHNKGLIFHGKEVRNCLPKGFRHASAPSRYVNYHILGSIECSQDKNFKKLP